MQVGTFIVLYLISLPVFFAIDMLWLGLIASDFYKNKIGHLMGDINWPAAIIFYLIFLVGLTIFATYPAVEKQSWVLAFGLGAAFGFFTYATYDLTNLATLKDWPLSVTLVDMLWGTCLGGLVALITYVIYQTCL